jgi:hypothetical protein
MKIVGVCKTFQGRCFVGAVLDSVYRHVDKMIYIHGETDWLGRPGNNVRDVVKNAADPDKKLIHLDAPPKATQEEQYNIATDYILREGIDFDYIFLSDTDEVFTDEGWAAAIPELEANNARKSPVLAYKVRLHTYVKSPFYRVTPMVGLQPVTFIHRSTVKPGIIGIRGGSLSKVALLLEHTIVHHFSDVRASLDVVWAKHETSCGSEREPMVDKNEWVETVWNKLPHATNCLPLKNYKNQWAAVETVGLSDLPSAVRDIPIVKAWEQYMKIMPSNTRRDPVTPKELIANGFPPDFGPNHPYFKFPSWRNKYMRLISSPAAQDKAKDTTSAHTATETTTQSSAAFKTPPSFETQNTVCVTTIVSGDYQWYIPLFLYCLKKSNPGVSPLIYVRGKCELPGLWKKVCIEIEDKYQGDGYTTAALRFVYSDAVLEQCQYTLITDIDILMMPERMNFVRQHLNSMEKKRLECYDNYISTNTTSSKKVPGVHFVTQDWWKNTAEARSRYQKELVEKGSPSWEYDELMLYRIIHESGLPEPPTLPNLWAHHGVHLGDYRRALSNSKNKNVILPRPQADVYQFIQSLLADRMFTEIVQACSSRLPCLETIFKHFRKLHYL